MRALVRDRRALSRPIALRAARRARDVRLDPQVAGHAARGLQLHRVVVDRVTPSAGNGRAQIECRPHLAHDTPDVVGPAGGGIVGRKHAHLVVVDAAERLGADVEVLDAAAVKELGVAEERASFLEERPPVAHEFLGVAEADAGHVGVGGAEVGMRRHHRRQSAAGLVAHVDAGAHLAAGASAPAALAPVARYCMTARRPGVAVCGSAGR